MNHEYDKCGKKYVDVSSAVNISYLQQLNNLV